MFLVRKKGSRKEDICICFSLLVPINTHMGYRWDPMFSGGPMVETFLDGYALVLATGDAMPALEKCLCICNEWSSMGAR